MKLHRLRTWSGYLGFLLFVLLLFFFTDAYVFFLLDVLFFCLPLFSLLLFRLQTRHLQIELQAGNDTCQIRLHAPSPLGSPLIHLQLDTYNHFTQERAAHTLSLTEDTDHRFSEIAMGVIDIQGVQGTGKRCAGTVLLAKADRSKHPTAACACTHGGGFRRAAAAGRTETGRQLAGYT